MNEKYINMAFLDGMLTKIGIPHVTSRLLDGYVIRYPSNDVVIAEVIENQNIPIDETGKIGIRWATTDEKILGNVEYQSVKNVFQRIDNFHKHSHEYEHMGIFSCFDNDKWRVYKNHTPITTYINKLKIK